MRIAHVLLLGMLLSASILQARTDQPPIHPDHPDRPDRPDSPDRLNAPVGWLHSSVNNPAKTAIDTVYLYGGPDTWEGKFENAYGPDWQGWTHRDLNEFGDKHWHISTYYAANLAGHGPGNLAMYCGDPDIPACTETDSVGGVAANMWDELNWYTQVPNPTQSVELQLTAYMNYDLVDEGWDFVEIWLGHGENMRMLAQWSGSEDNIYIDLTTTITPEEYTGEFGDQLKVFWRVWSDGVWDDEDCLSPSHGACQIDDVSVYLDGQLITFDDFEEGSPVHWVPADPPLVGDFASLRQGLHDLDPCLDNHSWQVSFIDDGEVVPGTGGTPCLTWCYGPGGWILNNNGGLAAGDAVDWFLENQVESPPIPWVDGLEGSILSFDVYVHEPLLANSPGIFYDWHVRSTASMDPADLELASWESDHFVHYGGPEYRHHFDPTSHLLVADRQWVQIALEVNELGWTWGWNGDDGTPAPYFDNVALRAWEPQGPEFLVAPHKVFMDTYPESGQLNMDQLETNWCRVDPVLDLNRYEFEGGIVRGDSLVVQMASLRPGAEIHGVPLLHWVLDCNPVFDGVRGESPHPNGLLRGARPGNMVAYDVWAFDLPDTGFFFPGDVLHYYVTAQDNFGGDIRMAAWPADTTGVLDFSPYSLYPEEATARALPSVTTGQDGDNRVPSMLVCDDGRSVAHTRRLKQILREQGFVPEVDYDFLHVEGGNHFAHNQGLAAIPSALLSQYETIFYSSGDQANGNLTGATDNSPDDGEILVAWLGEEDKRVLLMGSSLLSDLESSSSYGQLDPLLGVALESANVESLIGADQALQVTPIPSNGTLPGQAVYHLLTHCQPDQKPDAVLPAQAGVALGHLEVPGLGGGYYSAAVTMVDPALNNRTVFAPLDLASIQSPAQGYNDGQPMSGRARFVGELLDWLGANGTGFSSIPEKLVFAVDAYPNPFNPLTTIAFTMPRNGHLSLKVFDVRGRLVRTLVDGAREAGSGQEVWDGRDSQGAAVPSGIYFYQASAAGETRVGKLTLLK